MTEHEGESQWPIGSVANDHLRTSGGWIPLIRKSRADGPPWSPGDVVDGHVMTESGAWVSTGGTIKLGPPLQHLTAPPASARQRWRRLPLAAKIALGALAAWAVLAVIGLIVSTMVPSAEIETKANSEPKISEPTKFAKEAGKAKAKLKADPATKYARKMKSLGWAEVAEDLWLHKDFSCSYDGYSAKVTGSITTAPGVSRRYASISFGLYDDSGAILGTAIANITNLAEGAKWKFEAIGMTGKFARCQVADATGW